MDSSLKIGGMIDQLEDNLDHLQDALKTILSKSLGELAADYPVLDRAKLYVLVTYAIESAIFCRISSPGSGSRWANNLQLFYD